MQPTGLSQESESFISSQLAAGAFQTRDDLLDAAVRELRQRDEYRDWLKTQIAEGLQAIDDGRVLVLDSPDELRDLGERIIQQARESVSSEQLAGRDA